MTNYPDSDVIKLDDVLSMTKLSRSSVYAMMALDEFPRPVKVGKRAVAWFRKEVAGWLKDRAENNRAQYV